MESLKDKELLQTKVGIEFEFIYDDSIIKKGTVKSDLQKLLNVKINIEDKHHSEFKPTETHWKIEPDFSGGEKTLELVTGALDYQNGRICIMKVLNYIKNTKGVYTTERCGIHLNVNYPKTRYIADIDILKFILLFDENEVYSRFPNREDNIYTKSIKEIIPLHSNFDFKNISTGRSNFTYPNTKYYGVNFEKLNKGYLEFRYLGGKGYETKQSDILYLLDYFLLSLKNSYESDDSEIKQKLIDLLEPKKDVFLAGQSYFNFKNIFKNIEFKVDTKDNEETLKLFFPIMWSNFFPFLIRIKNIKYNMKGIINYDTDKSIIEFSGFNFKNTLVNNHKVLFHNCNLKNMVMMNTRIYECKVSTSDLDGVRCYDSDFLSSRIKNESIFTSSTKDCYLDNVNIKDSEIESGVFRKGNFWNTTLSDSVLIIGKLGQDVVNMDEKED